jgi:hypothetical protein
VLQLLRACKGRQMQLAALHGGQQRHLTHRQQRRPGRLLLQPYAHAADDPLRESQQQQQHLVLLLLLLEPVYWPFQVSLAVVSRPGFHLLQLLPLLLPLHLLARHLLLLLLLRVGDYRLGAPGLPSALRHLLAGAAALTAVAAAQQAFLVLSAHQQVPQLHLPALDVPLVEAARQIETAAAAALHTTAPRQTA